MPTQIIWPFILLQIATVVAIVFFLRMLLHKQLEIGMNRIKKLDRENLQKETQLNDKLMKFNEEYDDKIRSAEEHAEALITNAKEEARKMYDDERAKAKEEAKRIINSALLEKENVLKESRRKIEIKAIEFSEHILKQILSEKELSGLRADMTRDNIAMFLSSDEVTELLRVSDSAEIITAEALPRKYRDEILKDIKKNTGKDIDLKFSEDKDILSGVIIKTGDRVIDGGLYQRISKAVIGLKEYV